MATLTGSKRALPDADPAPATAPAGQPPTKKQLRKLRKQTPAEKLEIEYRLKVVECVKSGDAAKALEIYEQMKAEAEISIAACIYPMILNICCNHEQSASFQKGAFQVFQDMKQAAAPASGSKGKRRGIDETMYSALIKLCSKAHDFEAAEGLIEDLESAGTPPKLRTFAPLLEAYSETGELAKCEDILAKIESHAIPMTEAEHIALLRVCEKNSASDKFYAFLDKFIEDIPQPSESAWAVLRRWFASEAAQVEGRAWKIAEEKVDAQGVSSVTGDQLASLELSEADTHTLLAKVESLVRTDEKRIAQWDAFKAWLNASGPFDVVIDAANVGYFNQNFDGGGFDYEQIDAMVQHYQAQGKRVLIVLHKRRTLDEQVPREHRAMVAGWASSGVMFNCQPGNNDDWYWLFAAVKLGGRTLVVSNDEMRDHHFQMIHNRAFARWKERHQVHYHVLGRRVRVQEPTPFSARPQRVGNNWHFPVLMSGGGEAETETKAEASALPEPTWFCVTLLE